MKKLDNITRRDCSCYTCDEYRRFTSDEVEELSQFICAHHGHRVKVYVYRPVESIVEE